MNTKYDPEANIMMFTAGSGSITHAKEKNGIIIHMTSSNVPVLIEVLDASNFISTFAKLTEARGKIKTVPTAS